MLCACFGEGITFLNVLDVPYRQIEYIVYLHPPKHRKFVACTGQQVIAADLLKEYYLQTAIITNPIYSAEIQGVVREFGWNPEFVLAQESWCKDLTTSRT